jgi:hypothetical protein
MDYLRCPSFAGSCSRMNLVRFEMECVAEEAGVEPAPISFIGALRAMGARGSRGQMSWAWGSITRSRMVTCLGKDRM